MIIDVRVERGGRGEDRALVRQTGGAVRIAVADGAGGTGSGAQAAQRACEFVCAQAAHRSWVEHLEALDTLLLPQGGETTLVVVEIADGQVWGASVGDSGAWLVRSTDWIDLTVGQRRKPLLGSGEARPVGFGPVMLDGQVLVATDGLLKYQSPQVICAHVRQSSAESLDALINILRGARGALPDDVALVCSRA